jgi:hypothetical protein
MHRQYARQMLFPCVHLRHFGSPGYSAPAMFSSPAALLKQVSRTAKAVLRVAILAMLLVGIARAEIPVPRCKTTQGRRAEHVDGEVSRGETFTKPMPGGWVLRLDPAAEGWLLQVTSEDRTGEDLTRLTPPWHSVPNPRQIDGWHFRNAENTGPNDGSVNAPQQLREFIFSPRVGRDIQGPDAKASPTAEQVNEVRSFGQGWLFIHSYTLTPERRGERAAFETLRFSACLTWAG